MPHKLKATLRFVHSRGVVLNNTGWVGCCWGVSSCGGSGCLRAKAVQGAALALEGVDHVKGGHGLAAGVLSVGHGIAHHVLKEHLEHTAGLLVDEAADALDTTTASQAADSGLGDALQSGG